MMRFAIRKLMALAICLNAAIICQSQSGNSDAVDQAGPAITESRPFKILTSGKQITVKSTKEIRSIMVWTSTGHRILEEKEINASSYNFIINNRVNGNIFFMMVQLRNGKLYTEKIGL